jgi:hypothetical protein
MGLVNSMSDHSACSFWFPQSTEDWNKAHTEAGDKAVVVDFFAECGCIKSLL